MEKKQLRVLCTCNNCRSRIAEGYLRDFAADRADVFSEGTEAHELNPHTVETMAGDGIDRSVHTSETTGKYRDRTSDFVITVCGNAREQCPWFQAKVKLIHRNFHDPSRAGGSEEEINGKFRRVRQQLKEFCRQFVPDNL